MKRNLSSQAIKAMAIGMAVTVSSTTVMSGVNVYANDKAGIEKVSTLEEVQIEEDMEDTESVEAFLEEDIQPAQLLSEKEVLSAPTDVSGVNTAIESANDGVNTVIDLSDVTDFSNDTITIKENKDITLTSSKKITDAHIKLVGNGKLTIKNLNIEGNTDNKGFIEVTGKNNTITLVGDNTFTKVSNANAEAIKVDYNTSSENELTLTGDGNLTITGYEVGIGSKTDLVANDIKANKRSQDNLVINTTGDITMTDISHVGIGTRLGYEIQSSSYSNGLIENGNINIKTTDSGLGVSIHQMTGGNVTIENNYDVATKDNSKTVVRPGFAADTITGGTLNVNTTKSGNDKSTTVSAHIVNIKGGDINLKIADTKSTGLFTSSIVKGNISIVGDKAKDTQTGIKLYNYEKVWQGESTNYGKTENPGINPEGFGDVNISIKDVKEDIKYIFAKGNGSSEEPGLKNVVKDNYLLLSFNEATDGYTDLTINRNNTKITLEQGTKYFIFNLPDGEVKATVTKNGEIYSVLKDNDKVLGTVNTDNKELKVLEATVSKEAEDPKIYVTSENGKYAFDVKDEAKKEVTLTGYEKTDMLPMFEGSNFEKGKVTVDGVVYTLTQIGNGTDSLINIDDKALEGHTENVKTISANAFKDNKVITKADFANVTEVGENAFANTNVVSVDLGSKVEGKVEVSSNAFDKVSTLKNIATNDASKDVVKTAVENSSSKDIKVNAGGKEETIKPSDNTSGGSGSGGSNSGGSGSGGSGSSGGGANIGKNNDDTEEATTNNNNNNSNSSQTVTQDKVLSFDAISLPSVEGEAKVFGDVSDNHWAKSYIDKLSTAGVINGANGMFNPNGQTKRADVTVMLVNLLGLTPETNDKFLDVNPSAYYAPYVGAASSYGIVNGSNGMFNPEGIISRQDTMVMIAQILKGLNLNVNADASTLNQFSDANSVAGYANESVAILVNSGIISGNNGKLNPTAPVTRAEMATIMSKLYDVLASANN